MNKNIAKAGLILGATITAVTATRNSCEAIYSINGDDKTPIAIRKAAEGITWEILYCCCIKVVSDILK